MDLAFLPVEDFLAGGGGQAVLADGEPDTSRTLTPGDRAEIVTADTDYGRRLAARTDPAGRSSPTPAGASWGRRAGPGTAAWTSGSVITMKITASATCPRSRSTGTGTLCSRRRRPGTSTPCR